jgi:protein-S-isoprenylcysteine O-methyltransferase Ste14
MQQTGLSPVGYAARKAIFGLGVSSSWSQPARRRKKRCKMSDIYFDIFQIITLIAFLIVFIGRSIFLYARHGVNPLVLGIGKTGLRRIVEFAFFAGLLLWIIEIFSNAFHWDWHIFGNASSIILANIVLIKISGVAFILIGFSMFVLALVSFGHSWRIGIDEKSPGDLVTLGIFSISRNPIFLFIDLYFVGTFFIYSSTFFLVAAILVVVGLHYQILQEESFLKNNYGEPYLRYMERTSRYLGWRMNS